MPIGIDEVDLIDKTTNLKMEIVIDDDANKKLLLRPRPGQRQSQNQVQGSNNIVNISSSTFVVEGVQSRRIPTTMFAKRLFNKAAILHSQHDSVSSGHIDPKLVAHYGIPSTGSLLAFDPIQRLLAIATLDGRIKVIGGDLIEGLLISSKQTPYKYLEFLHNQGFLIGVTNDNSIQVWDLESRSVACSMQWECNITAFSVIETSQFMYLGDEYGLVSTVKYEAEIAKLLKLPYQISPNDLYEAAGIPSRNYQPVVGVLAQPGSAGNRILIAYEHGLLILWDVKKGQVLVVRGNKGLQLKAGAIDPQIQQNDKCGDFEEKEIGTLCWASSDGSVIAVGYIDGDILFWNMPSSAPTKSSKEEMPSNDVLKLQLSSADKRLPVITLYWSPKSGPSKGHDGLLFVYGGDEIGAEEVLTVMLLEWSSGIDKARCAFRQDLNLHGTFADMILLRPSPTNGKDQKADLFVLTNPGQLHYYDDTSLYALIKNQETQPSVYCLEYPSLICTADTQITAARLSLVSGNVSKYLSELVSATKSGPQFSETASTNWPVTGGVPSQLAVETHIIERIYIAGYQDGSIRIYDATYATLSLIYVLENKVPGVAVAASTASVTEVDFCSSTLMLAVGNKFGLTRIYNLRGLSEDSRFPLITKIKDEVPHLFKVRGHFCGAAISVLSSSVSTLKFSNDCTRLAIGHECGRIAVVDINSLALLFLTDQALGSSPVISIIWKGHTQTTAESSTSSESTTLGNSLGGLMLILTKDAKLGIVDCHSGRTVSSQTLHLKKELHAVSMFLFDRFISVPGSLSDKELTQSTIQEGQKAESAQDSDSQEGQSRHSTESSISRNDFFTPLVVLCFEDSIHIYTVKSMLQGNAKPIHKVKLAQSCCLIMIFNETFERCGIVLLYYSGVMEIRSFPNLNPVQEISLMSLLRWNYQSQMERKIVSSGGGDIAMVNGSEFALFSLLADVNFFRIPESLPSLHDKVLAAASTASSHHAGDKKKKQGASPGFMGVVKGLKGGKAHHNEVISLVPTSFEHLEQIFLKPPFPDLEPFSDQQKEELDIDEVVIDEKPVFSSSSSSHKTKNHVKEKGKKSEREKLLEGATSWFEPKVRTPEEILATYRKAGDTSSAAAHARSKLVERQEKLERISKGAEELQNGAENFASLANELIKVMEERNNRKWWNK